MAGGGGGGGNQTTRTEPPTYQLPYLQHGLQQAKSIYGQGPAVVPFSPQSEMAMAGTEQRALQGSPVTRGAQDYVTKSLQGGFLGSNPYLDATFNKAALATQNQLASEFARSGRNVDASQGLRSQQLNVLATNIYGGAYDAERNRQQGVLGAAIPLANQDYTDLAQLRGVGTDVEGLAREYADAQGGALDQYLGRVSGNMGQTTTSPLYRNRAAGALGGAATGYALGGALGGAANGATWGPWGALIGAGLGLLG